MAEGYKEIPENFCEIEPYVIWKQKQITEELITAEKCFFYDACSFRWHAGLIHSEYVADYLKQQQGVLVITRCILMELASITGVLDLKYVEYIRKMRECGLKILVIYEEDLFDVMNLCFGANRIINKYFSLAVQVVKRSTGTIQSTLKSDSELLSEIMKGEVTHSMLLKSFFQKVRQRKEAGDNLGEELLTICVHMLSATPERKSFKYIIMTDDKGAVGMINKAARNIWQYRSTWAFSALTTPRIAQRLYEEKIVTEKVQIEEILREGMTGEFVRILGSEEYDLEPVIKKMSCEELAEKIAGKGRIHINY